MSLNFTLGMSSIDNLALTKIILIAVTSYLGSKMISSISFKLTHSILKLSILVFFWLRRTSGVICCSGVLLAWLFVLNSRNHRIVFALVLFVAIKIGLIKMLFLLGHITVPSQGLLPYHLTVKLIFVCKLVLGTLVRNFLFNYGIGFNLTLCQHVILISFVLNRHFLHELLIGHLFLDLRIMNYSHSLLLLSNVLSCSVHSHLGF
jgi:hypothetical protein